MKISGLEGFIRLTCHEFDLSKRIQNDPVEFIHRYKHKKDIEIAGIISALFSYGRVELFKPVIERILEKMGESPYDFLINLVKERCEDAFKGFYYRFQKQQDIVVLMMSLSAVLKRFGDIETAFSEFYRPDDLNTGKAIDGFSRYLLYLSNSKSGGLRQLFPLPSNGSACKRMNLFLRWMVRKDEIDRGIWNGIPRNKLIIPLDVHISRMGLMLKLTRRRTPDWKMAVEITESLKTLDPDDPLKYDFILCHIDMMKPQWITEIT